MPKPKNDQYPENEASERFSAALRGAFNTPPAPAKTLPPKKPKAQQQKRKPAKASPSGASGASE